MNRIEEGLFAVGEQMPCHPRAICVLRYALPSTLGRAEQEEAAARILSFSQQLDQWVGVSWARLVEMMQKDLDLRAAVLHNDEEYWRVRRAVRKYYALCVLTFGIYTLFVAKPTAQMREVKGNLPFSGIFLYGSSSVITGIRELIGRGMLRREENSDVFFPTPALVSHIMQKQGVAAR